MIVVYVVGAAVLFASSFYYGRMWAKDEDQAAIKIAEYKVQRANRDAGRLSKRIHKQRLMIRKLKEQLPPPVKKERPAHTAVVEH